MGIKDKIDAAIDVPEKLIAQGIEALVEAQEKLTALRETFKVIDDDIDQTDPV